MKAGCVGHSAVPVHGWWCVVRTYHLIYRVLHGLVGRTQSFGLLFPFLLSLDGRWSCGTFFILCSRRVFVARVDIKIVSGLLVIGV